MKIPLLSRLFHGTSEAGSGEDDILLLDFDLHPARTATVTPRIAEPPVATAVVEPSAAAPGRGLESGGRVVGSEDMDLVGQTLWSSTTITSSRVRER